MDKKEWLLKQLASCAKDGDTEMGHVRADDALLNYIGDEDISTAFNMIYKWYA